jgi:very-short-patch-repair endonuclease
MFETALDKLERQQIDFYKYEEAIKTIEEYNVDHCDKFDSSEEIIAAIILIQNRYHIRPQVKVGKYQADFMLPDDKVILEIDGERHKNRKDYDSRRDTKMKEILGEGWQIIRIPTDFLDTKAEKLPYAIEKVLDYRDTKKVDWRNL